MPALLCIFAHDFQRVSGYSMQTTISNSTGATPKDENGTEFGVFQRFVRFVRQEQALGHSRVYQTTMPWCCGTCFRSDENNEDESASRNQPCAVGLFVQN